MPEYSLQVGSALVEGAPANPESCILLQKVTGLSGRPRRQQSEALGGSDGDVLGPATRAGITLVVEALIVGTGKADLRARERALRQALEPVDAGALLPVTVLGRLGDPVGGLVASMRVQGELEAPDEPTQARVKPATFALAAESATWAGAVEETVAVPPPATTGGLTFSVVFPIGFASSTSPGKNVVNDGDALAWPLLRLYGPSTRPALENLTTAKRLTFSVYDVPDGGWLDIDTRPGHRDVRVNGASPGYGLLDRVGSDWWGLVPGVNSIRLLDYAHNNNTRLDVIYRAAYT